MAKEKTFKTIFPAVSVPLNDDYSINEEEFRVYLRWIKSFYGKGIEGLVCNGHTGEITDLTRAERKRVVEICAEECPDISLITCHDETLCVSWFPGMDGALIGFAGCVPELICPAREVFANPDKHTLKEAQDWSDRIYHISQAIYGGGQPSGEAHARLKEALYQRGIFSNALMRKPVLPLNQEEKDWVALGLERSKLPKVDMSQFK
ncbi:MAG: dihydrodipicolinate synthase family protein [Eubacterium sp.]|nr:dihydrodipicolinate synthase family protein [Eubacterium sp.]MDD7208924.1 dihydrodipicolinate synthase family protein [Lachnospiraceae bacterium]MDY5496573.1 dihydrodipicolinate synthase family protein [Anaerobutyricum sp.]